MSTLNRKQLRKMLLKEFKMIGMTSPHVGMIGHSPYQGMDHSYDDHQSSDMVQDIMHGGGHEGQVSKEDCCKAVLCLIECCDCPETKALLRECCEDILSRC